MSRKSRGELPNILLIDDESEAQSQRLLADALKPLANVNVVSPEDVTQVQLSKAVLVLLDFNLGKWKEVSDVPIARKPVNGLALASVLRAHLGDDGIKNDHATAFALRSGLLRQLVGESVNPRSVHLLARSNNLEWVFSKGEPTVPEKIVSLANAVIQLRTRWRLKDHGYRHAMDGLLGLGDTPWKTTAWEDIDVCHPPHHDHPGARHGIPFLRWLLHRVLPYPCFLWSHTRLANRLRITEKKLEEFLKKRGPLANGLAPARYAGILSDFDGPRWWSAGVEAALWTLTKGSSHDPHHLAKLVNQREVEGSNELDSVLCIDGDLKVVADVVPSRLAVRVMPDDWPPFAEQPWVPLGLVEEEPSLRAIVNKADLPRLKGRRDAI
jgi:hypothetical protein